MRTASFCAARCSLSNDVALLKGSPSGQAANPFSAREVLMISVFTASSSLAGAAHGAHLRLAAVSLREGCKHAALVNVVSLNERLVAEIAERERRVGARGQARHGGALEEALGVAAREPHAVRDVIPRGLTQRRHLDDLHSLGDLAELVRLHPPAERLLAEEDDSHEAVVADAQLVEILERRERRVVEAVAFVEAEGHADALLVQVFEQLLQLPLHRDQAAARLLVEVFENGRDDCAGLDAPHYREARPHDVCAPRAPELLAHANLESRLAAADLADDGHEALIVDGVNDARGDRVERLVGKGLLAVAGKAGERVAAQVEELLHL